MMSNAHALLRSAQAATTDAAVHAYVRDVITRLEAVLSEALTCPDPERARMLLPAALIAVQTETGVLLGRSLLASTTWADQQHRALYTKAQQLFGAEAGKIVQPPAHEPYVPARSLWR